MRCRAAPIPLRIVGSDTRGICSFWYAPGLRAVEAGGGDGGARLNRAGGGLNKGVYRFAVTPTCDSTGRSNYLNNGRVLYGSQESTAGSEEARFSLIQERKTPTLCTLR